MSAKHVLAAALFLAAGVALASAPDDKKEPPKDKGAPAAKADPAAKVSDKDVKEAELRAQFVEDVAAAYRMAEVGYDEKTPSPEALVAAGSLLRKLHVQYSGVLEELKDKPTSDKGDDAALKATSLEAEANRLFGDAETKTGGNKKLLDAVKVLVAAAKARDYEKVTRGAAGGPKTITRGIAAGATHTYNITFLTGIPAAIGMRTSGIACRCEMSYENFVHFNQVAKVGNYTWTPRTDTGPRRTYTITIKNVSTVGGQYVFFTN